jgi:hypothetical protein
MRLLVDSNDPGVANKRTTTTARENFDVMLLSQSGVLVNERNEENLLRTTPSSNLTRSSREFIGKYIYDNAKVRIICSTIDALLFNTKIHHAIAL